ncbi:hypothetical protein DMENIID0001_149740 [Sergentomyia squamirostris]
MQSSVFSARKQWSLATLLLMLLLLAGIETNPGPVWTCSVCRTPIRRSVASVLCNGCRNWCHLRRCAGLGSGGDWSDSFRASCCLGPVPSPPSAAAHRTAPPSSVASAPPGPVGPGFGIMQLNCNGLRNKIDELVNFMCNNRILVAAIQESKLPKTCNLVKKNQFTILRCDRERDRGGGLAFVIDPSVLFRPVSLPCARGTDPYLEQQAIAVKLDNTEITLINVYIPPASSCEPGYKPSIEHLLDIPDSIIMGDVNAHHDLWFSRLTTDARGELLAEQIDASTHGVANEDEPTRLVGGCSSSPDVTLAHDSLLPSVSWSTHVTLGSDHVPIVIVLEYWESFTRRTEDLFTERYLPIDVITGERTFVNILTRAKAQYIPSGRIKLVTPNFPGEAARLARRRDEIRRTNPDDDRLSGMNKRISYLVDEHKRAKWRETLSKADLHGGNHDLWKVIKGMTRPKPPDNNCMIEFDSATCDSPVKCAEFFNAQFFEKPRGKSKLGRAVRRSLRGLGNTTTEDVPTITTENVVNSIKRMKPSKALGPDELSPIMLKHLGPLGINYLTSILNTSLSTLTVPDAWKRARVIPILKPGKPANRGSSYRPISLLSPLAKVMESTLLSWLKCNFQLADHQHGFRELHSTTTALQIIQKKISDGLNQKKPCARSILVALDLSKAFDTVPLDQLLEDIHNTTLPAQIKRWLHGYLTGRLTSVEFRNKRSGARVLRQGVPQGGVLSPLLFNLYMSHLPSPPPGLTLVSYADDVSVLATGNDLAEMTRELNSYLQELNDWFIRRGLRLSPEKSSSTLFTTWTKEVHTVLGISIAGNTIPTVKSPRILGIHFDPMLVFNTHIKTINTTVKRRNNVLKTLAGTSWGKCKETIVDTYKSLSRSVLSYGCPIWSPQVADTNWKQLQTSQNAALKIATGCHGITHQDHLHQECKLLPVREHNTLLTAQALLAMHRVDHPSHTLLHHTSPPRHVRKSVFGMRDRLNRVLTKDDSTIDREHFKSGLKTLHTEFVERAINTYAPNRVLGTSPPPISEDELSLPRETRCTLAQLRSGFCRLLNNYRHRLDPEVHDKCADCGHAPHDVGHLFECPQKPNPGHLDVADLWARPREVAEFLALDCAVADWDP